MIPQPPPGQGPIDPRGAFTPPPPPSGNVPPPPPPVWMPPGMMPGMMPPPMPPPGMYPPMFMPPPQRPARSFSRAVFVTLATSIFGLSLTLNIYLLIASGIMSGGGLRTSNLVEGDPRQKIAVVPVNGVIMDQMAAKFDRWMSAVEKDGGVK